jgi:hypothetical protein
MNDFLELTKGLVESHDFEETSNFEPIEAGTYRVQVTNVEKKVSQNGNEYVSMVLEICDGDLTGRKIWNNLFFTAKTAENTIKRIYKQGELAGVEPRVFSDIDSIVEYCAEFINSVFEIEYDEEAFVKVKFTKGL